MLNASLSAGVALIHIKRTSVIRYGAVHAITHNATRPWFDNSSTAAVGLKNLGNSHFMNSVLQVFLHTPPSYTDNDQQSQLVQEYVIVSSCELKSFHP